MLAATTMLMPRCSGFLIDKCDWRVDIRVSIKEVLVVWAPGQSACPCFRQFAHSLYMICAGRINKLVDGCYSFWQGAVPALAHLELHRMEHAARAARSTDSKQATDSRGPSTAAVCESFAARRLPCRSVALQRYLLKCCQVQNGGLRDKPGQ